VALESQTVSCGSWHDLHLSLASKDPAAPVGFLRGTGTTQICADCHQSDALRKYGFFHDRLRRRK
jgi:hypothetical protein